MQELISVLLKKNKNGILLFRKTLKVKLELVESEYFFCLTQQFLLRLTLSNSEEKT